MSTYPRPDERDNTEAPLEVHGASYGTTMAGPGAWALLEGADDATHGVLWTDFQDNLGLVGVLGTDSHAHAALMAQINACAREGVATRDAWGAVLIHYGNPTVYEGELLDLADTLSP